MNTLAALPAQRRGRLQLIFIALLFAAPVVGAWMAWKFVTNEGVSSTTNAGVLVQPARPLSAEALGGAGGDALSPGSLTGRWSYVVIGEAACDAVCAERLYLTRQARTSVNKDMSRVQRLLVLSQPPADPAALRAAHPDLLVAVLDAGRFARFTQQFASSGESPAAAFYLVDPLGNLMMRYAPQVPFKGILKDLRKLLKVSQVG